VNTRVGAEGGEGGVAPFFVCFVDEGTGELVVELNRLFAEDMLDLWLDGDVVIAIDGCEVRVRSRSLGEQFGVTRVRGGWVLGYRGLYAFYC
jgi:hypothetical protein